MWSTSRLGGCSPWIQDLEIEMVFDSWTISRILLCILGVELSSAGRGDFENKKLQ